VAGRRPPPRHRGRPPRGLPYDPARQRPRDGMGPRPSAAAALLGRRPCRGRRRHPDRDGPTARAPPQPLPSRRTLMSTNLPLLLETFRGLHVLVVGEAMLDSYVVGTTDRFCPEAPVPVVNLADRTDVPGGAANAAVNVRSLGGQVSFLSVTGTDPEAALLRH